jgi:hypothetical protein
LPEPLSHFHLAGNSKTKKAEKEQKQTPAMVFQKQYRKTMGLNLTLPRSRSNRKEGDSPQFRHLLEGISPWEVQR